MTRNPFLLVLLVCGCLVAWSACDSGDDPDPVCGNGTQETGEECDDGNTLGGDGCSSSCQVEGGPVCGNGTVEGTEECDDGNTTGGDGCSATCTNEGGAVCGNGVVEGNEECDDGNTNGGDGCSASCMNEGGDTYSVSGGAGRVSGTCPDAYGSIGTLCISLRTDCGDAGTEVASTEVANADMQGPLEMPWTPVDFELTDVPDGTYQLFGYLDKDGTGCAHDPTTDDLTLAAGCIEVVVDGADVTDADLGFDTIVQ